jgi:hypothetical protein
MSLKKTEDGFLAPGAQEVSLSLLLDEFGFRNKKRAYLGNLVAKLVDYAGRLGSPELLIGGSWVSPKDEPSDVDCALLVNSAAYPPQRWDAEDLVRLDLKLCASQADMLAWQALYSLSRDVDTNRGCVIIKLESVGCVPSEVALAPLISSPLAQAPRGTYSNVPAEQKLDVLSRLLFAEFEESSSSEISAKSVTKRLIAGFLKNYDPTGGEAYKATINLLQRLGIDFKDELLNGRVSAADRIVIVEQIRNQLRVLPGTVLDKVYRSALGRSPLSGETFFLIESSIGWRPEGEEGGQV